MWSKLLDELRKDGLKESTCRYNLSLIKQVWKWAKSQKYKVQDVEFPRVKVTGNRVRVMTLEEEQRLLKELDPRREAPGMPPYEQRDHQLIRFQEDNRDIVICLLDTGARIGEITGLKWEQVNLKEGTISLYRPKTDNWSIVDMTGRMKRLMERRQGVSNSPYVFEGKNSEQRKCNNSSIRKAIERAGLKGFTIHDLRHVYAAKMLKEGFSIYELSKVLGHSSVSMTEKYAWLCERDISKKAAKILDDIHERLEQQKIEKWVSF